MLQVANRFRPEEVLVKDDDIDSVCDRLGVPSCLERISKGRAMPEANFPVEHCDLYRLAKLEWPPADTSQQYARFQGFGVRVTEVAVFCNTAWKQARACEFIELNHSLGKLVNYNSESTFADLKNPWREFPNTITGNSKVAVRILMPGGTSEFRPLESFEVLSLIGWSFAWFNPDGVMPQHALCVSLAGNAFSAFACLPAALTLLLASGMPDTFESPLAPSSDED